ncbi:alpha/beta fold hydrolase [Candidatus Woesearchaeota archaeon]|nr:alpha/beta fold hydrolase [Candidatus Woesearchaeota archaeon]
MKKSVLVCLVFLLTACSSQMDTEVRPGNDGFVIGTGDNAILLTHGLSSSPREERALAEYLAAKNFTVYVVRLEGHGTSVEDLTRTKWEDWYKNYHEAYLNLKQEKQKVYVGGMSLGGVIALKLAEDEKVDGIIALAPSLVLDDERSKYAWFFKYFTKYSLRNISKEDLPYNYDRFPISSVAEMLEMSAVVQADLSKIDEPILIMQYRDDYRVNPASSQIVYEGVSSSKKDLDWIEGNGHVMITAPDKETHFGKIYGFIRNL